MNVLRKFWTLKTRLASCGRVTLLFEPRDLWLGYFHGKDAGYIVVVPCLPVRIAWRA
jgi:hypothetical protein